MPTPHKQLAVKGVLGIFFQQLEETTEPEWLRMISMLNDQSDDHEE